MNEYLRNESNYEQVAISNQLVVFDKELEQQYKCE